MGRRNCRPAFGNVVENSNLSNVQRATPGRIRLTRPCSQYCDDHHKTDPNASCVTTPQLRLASVLELIELNKALVTETFLVFLAGLALADIVRSRSSEAFSANQLRSE